MPESALRSPGRSDPRDEALQLLDVLPPSLRTAAVELPLDELLEIVLDLGRPPTARLPGRTVPLADGAVERADLDAIVARVGEFGGDNRAGLPGTLHRISAMRNRRGAVVGLTLRVGRAMYGTIDLIRDLVESGLNILLLGRPGVGKTTKLREIARVLADDLGKRVVVIDTSNEIGGDGDVPHNAIGSARRMQVPRPDRQHDVMIEAVENHMPEAIVIDEIGTSAESTAARTIAERGVQLIATAHGNTLENLILNPTLSDLVGGVQTVTLSDEEAKRRRTQKTVTERRAPPTFDVVVELVGRDEVLVHRDAADDVDRILAGEEVTGEHRGESGAPPERRRSERRTSKREPAKAGAEPADGDVGPFIPGVAGRKPRIYAFGIGRELVERAVRALGADAHVVDRPERAQLVIARRSRAEKLKLPKGENAPEQVLVKRGSLAELQRALRRYLLPPELDDQQYVRDAVEEAEHAIQRVLAEGVSVPLAPRPAALRRLQHRLVSRYHLRADSLGEEPHRHLVIQTFGAAAGDARPDPEDR